MRLNSISERPSRTAARRRVTYLSSCVFIAASLTQEVGPSNLLPPPESWPYRYQTLIYGCFPPRYKSTALSGRPTHRLKTFSLRSSGNDEARVQCAQDPQREFSRQAQQGWRRPCFRGRVCTRFRASRRSASSRTEPCPHLAHRGDERGQHPWSCVRQWGPSFAHN